MAKPRKSVHKLHGSTLVRKFGISDNEPGNIHCEVSVTMQVVGCRKDKYPNDEQQHRIKRNVIHLDPIDKHHGKFAHRETHKNTDRKLNKNCKRHHKIVGCTSQADNLYQRKSKHISHGVVTTALQLQQRFQVVFQCQVFRAQNPENRCRIGR